MKSQRYAKAQNKGQVLIKIKETKTLKIVFLSVFLFITNCFCLITTLQAQLSTIHYLPPLYGRDDGILHRHFILVSNPNPTRIANILILDGSGDVLFNEAVNNNSTFKAFLGEGADANGIIETAQLNTIIRESDNLIVQSDIPVYVQIRHTVSHETETNPDRHLHGLISSSKGDWAIGKRFRTGFGFSSNSSLENNVSPDGRSDFISIMATEDETVIHFDDIHPLVNLGGVFNTPSDFDITLDGGESYTIAHFPDSDASNLRLNGVLVEANKPIVVNCGSWALDHSPLDNPDRSQREIAAEQIIPMERLSTEYVLMNVDGVELAEKVIIVGDQDNTSYFLNGNTSPTGNLNAGEFVVLDKDLFSAQGNLFVETSAPAPIYQTTGLQHFSVGYTIVTPLKCWGTRSTIIPRMDEDFVLEDSRINIVAPVGTNLSVSGGTVEAPESILGLPDYETYRVTPVVTDDIFITADNNVQVLTSYRSIARGAATYYAEYFQTDTMLVADRCLGESYSVGNSTYTSTGIFYDTLQNINGCDSLIMLDLTIHEPENETILAEVCQGDTYFFEGRYYAESGYYEETLISSFGCDSLVSLELIVQPVLFDTVNLDLCYGENFLGQAIENDTSVNILYASSLSCDSTVTLQVNVLEEFEEAIDFDICPGDEIEIDGQFFAAEGNYEINYTAQNGCDSLVQVNISHYSITPIYETLDVCIGQSYNGSLIQSDTTFYAAASTQDGCLTELITNVSALENDYLEQAFTFCPGMTYNDIAVYSDSTIIENLTNLSGCDSLVVTEIIMENFSSTDTVYLNSGDEYHGITYYTDDLAVEDLLSFEGCDSIAYIYIFINPVLTGVVNVDLCPGESYANISPSADTSYTTFHTASNGFDSITVFNIYIQETYVVNEQVTLCEGESISIFGVLENEAGIYENLLASSYGCDSLLIVEVLINPIENSGYGITICEGEVSFIAGAPQTESGTYTEYYSTQYGCDSIVEVSLEVLLNVESNFAIELCQSEMHLDNIINNDTLLIETFTASNGCDSIVYTAIQVEEPFASLDTVYVFEGEGYLGDTLLVDSLYSLIGCDSIVSLQVILLPSVSVILEETLCEGDVFNGIEIYQDTTFLETLLAANGADSFVVTQVYVNYNTNSENTFFVCFGELYNGLIIYEDTTFMSLEENSLGCDSLIYENINVIPILEDYITIYLIEGETYQGIAYQNDTLFTENYISGDGCLSILNTEVIIIPHVYTEETVYVCENENYQNFTIDADTILVQNLNSYLGSDSIHTTYVFMLDTITTYIHYSSCEGLPIEALGTQWYENETVTELVLNQDDCYDLEVHIFNFNENVETTIAEVICTGTSFFFNGNELNEAGRYYDTLKTYQACDSLIILDLSIDDEFEVQVFGAAPYCEGESSLIFVEGFESYLWSNGATNNELAIFETGSYEVTVTDQNGCIGYGNIQVPPPNEVAFDLDIFQPDCAEQDYGAVDVFIPLNNTNYEYQLNGNPINGLEVLTELLPGEYEFMVSDEIGCSQMSFFSIEVFEAPNLSIDAIESITLGDSTQLIPITNATDIDSIVWTPNQYLSCYDCLYPYASPINDYNYSLSIYTLEGCLIKASVALRVEKNYSIYIPNAFSPNSDGINDYFTVYAGGAVEEVQSLHLYDRWGEKVFFKESFPHNVNEEGWNGTFRNENIQAGVYVYYAEILLRTGEVIYEKGDFTLIR